MGLLLPVVVTLIIGLVELGRVQRWQVTLTAAAHAGALYASKNASSAADTQGVRDRVLAEIDEMSDLGDGHSQPVINVTVGSATGDGYNKQQVDVSVSVTVPPLFTVMGFPSAWVLTETSSSRVLAWEPGS